MKAISIHQPWASWVVQGKKQYETRPRKTNIRGVVAIHAAKKKTALWLPEMPLGAIVGVVEIVDCFPVEMIRGQLSAEELSRGDFSDGRYAWRLENPRVLKHPLPLRGYQGFWNLEESLAQDIENCLRSW
ncbi:MAG: ASCH domain-containing protein [Eubacterium sp.]|nr:ASCH domain-containing protein [Eubacterium sp.]